MLICQLTNQAVKAMYDLITIAISQLNVPLVTAIAKIIDDDLFFIVIILFLAFIAERGRRRNRLVLTLLLVFLLGTTVKGLVHEARPCAELISKIPCPPSFSFPSNHALMAFALVAALWKNKPNRWLYALYVAIAIFVGFTRIYLGVHTAADVVGGALLGILFVLVIDLCWQKIPKSLRKSVSDFLK